MEMRSSRVGGRDRKDTEEAETDKMGKEKGPF